MERTKKIKRHAPGEPEHKSRTIRLRVSEEEYQHYTDLAEKRKLSLSDLIRTGLRLLEIY